MYEEQKNLKRFYFFISGTCQSNLLPTLSLLVLFIAYFRKYLSNGISHVVCWFMVTDLEKLAISFRA